MKNIIWHIVNITGHFSWHFSNLPEHLCLFVYVSVCAHLLIEQRKMVLSQIILRKRKLQSQKPNIISFGAEGVVDRWDWNSGLLHLCSVLVLGGILHFNSLSSRLGHLSAYMFSRFLLAANWSLWISPSLKFQNPTFLKFLGNTLKFQKEFKLS